MMYKPAAGFLLALALAMGQLNAQGPPGPPPGGPGPMDRTIHLGPPGRWWSDPRLVQILQLSASQQKAMGNVFDQNRARLIELNNALRTEEAVLRPLVASDTLDEVKILSQIDRVAQARAELEKANGRMLIELRKLLVGNQWRRLQEDNPANRPGRPDHRP